MEVSWQLSIAPPLKAESTLDRCSSSKQHLICAREASPFMILVILSDSASISCGLLWMVVILEKSGPERSQQKQKSV